MESRQNPKTQAAIVKRFGCDRCREEAARFIVLYVERMEGDKTLLVNQRWCVPCFYEKARE